MGFLYIAIYIVIYLSLLLLPYYVAYSIIEPHSFFGIVGVFFLGSIIVPLSTMLASSIVAFISVILGIAKKEDKSYKKQEISDSFYEIKNVSETKNTSKKWLIFLVFSVPCFVQNSTKNSHHLEYSIYFHVLTKNSHGLIDFIELFIFLLL